MPQRPEFRNRTPIKVDASNNVYRLDMQTGTYKPANIKFEKKLAVSHVKTFIFDTEATVVTRLDYPGQRTHREDIAKPGDMLIVWSDGKHKIVPPKAQKWIKDLVPEPIALDPPPPPPDIPPGPDLTVKKKPTK